MGYQMPANQHSDVDQISIGRSIRDHRILFLVEGVILVVLGLLAVIVPSISTSSVTLALGWLFLVSGAVGLATTIWARHAPGFWWSLVSALLAILVGAILVANKSQELYGGLLGWPFETAGPLRLILALFFLIEGGASIMFAIEHRRQFSGRWAWMLASGIIDIVLASIIIFDLPGTSAWTMGLLVGINMILGGAALIAMGLHARVDGVVSNVAPGRNT
jgi:uncharacterized membrane protein HdeD (DUF308 family)